jgi:hypothetical protein
MARTSLLASCATAGFAVAVVRTGKSEKPKATQDGGRPPARGILDAATCSVIATYAIETHPDQKTYTVKASLPDVAAGDFPASSPGSRMFFDFGCDDLRSRADAGLVMPSLEILSERMEGKQP